MSRRSNGLLVSESVYCGSERSVSSVASGASSATMFSVSFLEQVEVQEVFLMFLDGAAMEATEYPLFCRSRSRRVEVRLLLCSWVDFQTLRHMQEDCLFVVGLLRH